MLFLAYDSTMTLPSDSNMVLWDDKGGDNKGYVIITMQGTPILKFKR